MARRPQSGLWLALGGMAVVGGLLLANKAMAAASEPDTGGEEPDDLTLETTMVNGTVRIEGPGPHFTWAEIERTSHALPNTMPNDAKLRMQALHDLVLGPLRRHLNRQILISSGFRSAAVNRAVGGSSTSRHMTGEALDIQVKGLSPEALAATIVAIIPATSRDQIIWYPRPGSASLGWVHIGIRVAEGNQGEVLRNSVTDVKVVNGVKKATYPAVNPNPALAV